MTVIRIGDMYNKGITMKSVNQSGRAVMEDMRRTIAASQPFELDAGHFKKQDGRLCTGSYSYVWNDGDAGGITNKYSDPTHKDATPIGLVRVRDIGAQLCANILSGGSDINYTNATELLSDNRLKLEVFDIQRLASGAITGSTLYSMSAVISDANDGAVSLNSLDTSCKPPNDAESNINFCAVNRFDFTALSNSNGGGDR